MLFFASLLSYFRRSHLNNAHNISESINDPSLSTMTLVIDMEGSLLRSSSIFPYFMLVALEAGGFLRGLILLLLYPLVYFLNQEVGVKIMVMVCFCGLRKERFGVGRTVLPKFFLEDVGLEGFEVMNSSCRRVCVSRLPRVMVEAFLRDFLEVEVVLARELKVFGGFYTGFMEEDRKVMKENQETNARCIGISSSSTFLQHELFSHCMEIYCVGEEEKRRWHPLPREKYPRPVIFHDGRIAFRPSSLNTLAMFMWLPLGISLAILRTIIGISLPYKLSTPILGLTGMKWRLKGTNTPPVCLKGSKNRGSLYVCNHRTLLDPVYVSVALDKPVTTVSYSLSRVSEVLSPIRTVRLTRNREKDRETMETLLSSGTDLVVCPEGTTCREPYLLRFSPLFAELTDEVVPVAVNVQVSMFYATTAGGIKAFDSFYYLINPSMCYQVEFLEKLCTTKSSCSTESANQVQGVIGRALGFECTKLARKDKYMILAGNDGIVQTNMDSQKLNKLELNILNLITSKS